MSRRLRARAMAAVTLVAGGTASMARGQAAPFGTAGPFFDYNVTDAAGGLASPDFAPAPFLDDNEASAADASALLLERRNAGLLLAVKVREPLTDPAALAVFDNFRVQYVFADYYDAARVGRTRSIADQVAASARSSAAFVGNFNFYPNAAADPTRPTSLAGSESPRFQFKPGSNDYSSSRGNVGIPGGGTIVGNQLAEPALLPGSPDFRNPAQANSGAPNIRSALFTLPIQRLTLAELGIKGFTGVPGGAAPYAIAGPNQAYTGAAGGRQQLIPYVTRFNNFGNPALGGGPSGTGFVQEAPDPAEGQLLSRGDFQCQMLHYRMRGADSLMLLDEGGAESVVGYTGADEQSDLETGWAASSVANGTFTRGNYAFANLSNVIGDSSANSGDQNPRSTELAGTVWSGVYDRAGSVDPATGRRRLTILMSNLSDVQKEVDLPNNIGGFSVFRPPGATTLDSFDNVVIAPGQHRLLNYALQTSSRGQLEWVFTNDQFIGLDNNRNGIGGPVGPAGLVGDFNADAIVDATDIDLLCDRINAGEGDVVLFDVNNDGSVDNADVTFEVEAILGTVFGDTDTDGDVDLNDLGSLASGFEQEGEMRWSLGNFDCDQDVDLNDLGTLATNFQGGRSAALGAFESLVPEPTCAVILGLLPAILLKRSCSIARWQIARHVRRHRLVVRS